jgi:signal transduction histidine kinase/ligand-binding sensor domain-containing protein
MIPAATRAMTALRVIALALSSVAAVSLHAATSPPAPDEIPTSEDYIVRTWEMDDGLPSNRIFTITQTPDGYLWLGTQGGLVRFDGARFTTFSNATTPGIEADRVHAVFVSRDGTLWIGQVGGAVARKLGDTFEIVVPAPKSPEPFELISSFAQAADGSVWIAHERAARIARWHDGQLRTFSSADGLPIGVGGWISASQDGTIWFANSSGCAVFDGTRFQEIDPGGGGSVHLAPARAGGMWATRENRLLHYQPDGAKRVVANLGSLSVHGLFEDTSGTLWIQTNMTGLIRFRDGELARVPIAGTSVSVVFEDRENNLWVGRQSGGLNRVRPRQFFLRQAKDGVLEDETYSVTEDSEGRLWLSGRANMLVRAIDRTNRRFATPAGWTNESSPRSVCADPAGGVWVGTLDGLLRWQGGVWSKASPRANLLGLMRDRTSALWMASVDGPLIRHRDGRDEIVGPVRARSVAEDRAGRIWVGTDDGQIFRRSGEHLEQITLPEAKNAGRVHFIVPDENDTVWIGVARAGFYRWRAGHVERLSPDVGFPTDDVRALIVTPEGDFWIGTGRGLFHTRRSELDTVLAGRQRSMWFRSFGRNHGVPIAEFGVGYRGAALRARDGHLWFATDRGALEIIPHESPRDTPPGRVLVEEITAGSSTLAPDKSGRIVVPARTGPLEVHYTLPELTRPEEIRFRHRLSGAGTDEWSSAGAERVASFTRLPAGNYRLEVAAFDAGGRTLPAKSAALDFTVQATWWETPAFRVAAALAGIAALSWLVRKLVLLRVRVRMRRLEQERALERERTRIARDMHDQLGASLTQIAITSKLLTLDPPERVAAHSQEIATIARRTVESLDEIVWAVDPANDSLGAALDYLTQFAVNFLSAAGIASDVQMPEELPTRPFPAGVRHHLYLAVKEALNNVARHAAATLVQMKISIEDRRVRVEVADNGRGFDPALRTAGSNGLRNLQTRMAEIGGECRIVTAPGRGTQIVLVVNLPALNSEGAT